MIQADLTPADQAWLAACPRTLSDEARFWLTMAYNGVRLDEGLSALSGLDSPGSSDSQPPSSLACTEGIREGSCAATSTQADPAGVLPTSTNTIPSGQVRERAAKGGPDDADAAHRVGQCFATPDATAGVSTDSDG